MTRKLHISDDLSLPLGIANKTICIFGKGGSGKSNLEVVLAEELYASGIPTCIVDPADVHYGIKSARDGKSAGLPFIIFGGLHADVPIYPENGVLLADLFLDRGLYMVIVTQPWTGRERSRFMTDFANQLYKRGPEKEQRGSARVLLLEEAHEYVPLSPAKDETVMLGAMKRLYTVGRNYWIGFIAATRRPARMHTDLRNGADATAFFQIVGTQDRKAMTDYLGEMAEKDVRDEIVSHVAKLPVGTAYFYQPHEKPALQRVHFRYRDTLDTTTTEITAGHKAIKPVLAKVDLSELGEAMEAAREKAKAEDPKELRRTISDLRGQIKKLESAKPATETKTKTEIKTVEKRIVIEGSITRLEKLQEDMKVPIERIETILERAHQERSHIAVALTEARELNAGSMKESGLAPGFSAKVPIKSAQQPRAMPAKREAKTIVATNGDFRASSSQQRILDALAWAESIGLPEMVKTQLALMSDQSPTSGGYFNNLGSLRTAGMLDYPSAGNVALTEAGRAQANSGNAPTTNEELHNQIYAKLSGSQTNILRELIAAYPDSIKKDDLAQRVGQSPTSGGYFNNLGRLRTLKLIDYPQSGYAAATAILFIE